MLTPIQLGTYREQGFLVVPGVIPQDVLDDARQATDEFIELSRGVSQSNDVLDLDPTHTADMPRVRRIKNPVQNHPAYDRILRHALVLDAVEDVFGPEAGIRLSGSKLNTKTGSAGAAGTVEWHQDFAFFPQTNADVLAVGVYLDDATLENGCMLMIPGSHVGPVLDHHQDGVFIGFVDPSRGETDFTRAVPVEAGAGSISLHHGHMLHASAPNRSARPRRLLIFELLAGDAWPLLGVTDLELFNGRLLRGSPTLTPRVEPVSVRIPLPLPEHSGSIFEIQEYAKVSAFSDR